MGSVKLSAGVLPGIISSWRPPTTNWGHRDQARSWYEPGAQWMEKNFPHDALLRRFRAEAEKDLVEKAMKAGPSKVTEDK